MKKMLLFVCFSIAFLFFNSNVKADTQAGWGNFTKLNMTSQNYLYNCNSWNCSDGNLVSNVTTLQTHQYNGNFSTIPVYSSSNIGRNGNILAFTTNSYSSDFVYALNVFFCSYKSLSDNDISFDLYATGNRLDLSRQVGHLVSNYYTGTSLNTAPFTDLDTNFKYCGMRSYIFQTDISGRYFSISMQSKTGSVYSTGGFAWLGYNLESLGNGNNLTSSDIRNVINNSGLATAKDINKVNQSINNVKKEMSNINDTINNSDSSGASSSAGNFFNNFNTDTFGLTSIITSPLNLIKSITSSSCSSLSLPLPFVNKDLILPCMTPIYQKYFGSFLILYQTITFGIVAYWVCVRIFNLVKDFKNPDHDEIEVLDL